MKYIILFVCCTAFGIPRDSKDLRIIHYHLKESTLRRHDAFRLIRSKSLPHIFETAQDTIIDVPHNVSEATVIETVHSEHKEKKQNCCSKYKVLVWSAVITTGGVVCASTLSTIVALVIHFAG